MSKEQTSVWKNILKTKINHQVALGRSRSTSADLGRLCLASLGLARLSSELSIQMFTNSQLLTKTL